MNGKGDARRPSQVPEETVEENWKRTFRKDQPVLACASAKLGYAPCKPGQPCVNPGECQ